MSFFGGSDDTNPSVLDIAKIESNSLMDLFNRMTTMCAKKCIHSQSDNELSVGEMTCVDRCTNKYLMSQKKISETLLEFEKSKQLQQQQTPQRF